MFWTKNSIQFVRHKNESFFYKFQLKRLIEENFFLDLLSIFLSYKAVEGLLKT